MLRTLLSWLRGIFCFCLVVVPAAAAPQAIRLQVIDSITGCRVEGATIQEEIAGQASLAEPFHVLTPGRHVLHISAPGYHEFSAVIQAGTSNSFTFRFLLDPIKPPPEIEPARIQGLKQDGATLFLGFVSDARDGAPLAGVRVSSFPGGAEALTDERGFFQIYVPVPGAAASTLSPPQLLFEKDGYVSEARIHLELAPGLDWKYMIAFAPGKGTRVIDENTQRRAELRQTAGASQSNADAQSNDAPDQPPTTREATAPVSAVAGDASPLATASTNFTVRVPRNIRVLEQNGTTVDYISLDTYCRHVLPSEWIASWGSIAGGTNSLNAGAVAVRCYAIVKINSASKTSAYDICATTSCQVYNPATSSSLTDTAVNYTANWVVVGANGAIATTEYSAENNSLANSCGDGFTEPSTSGPWCIYDPVCRGEARNGHGRGMCQWGTAKWATGRKMTGNVSGNTTTNGFPRRDWIWIVRHYYPALTLVKGAPLLIGDDVKPLGTVQVYDCGGTITNGIQCASIATKTTGATGTIIAGPLLVTADTGGTNGPGGFTWYQVQWSDNTVGWSQENYLERVFSPPSAPLGLTAVAATNQISLAWTDTSGGTAEGFRIQRGPSLNGPWVELTNTLTAITSYTDKGLQPGSTWLYRVAAFNAAGTSAFSSSGLAVTTSNTPPTLATIPTKTVHAGTLVVVTNAASAPDFVQLLTDFEPFASEWSNAVVMFRDPRFSGSTSSFIDIAPDLSITADVFPATGNSSARALHVSCNFTNPNNPWLRLTTASAGYFPNPIIDLTKKLQFRIYSDKQIQVAVGCRETTTAAGTTVGRDGGTTGAIEWAGVTNVSGTAPMPTRTVAASNWTTLTFNFPNEPIQNFVSGNGVLSTASGLGTLEHVAVVPNAGLGTYNLYLDDVQVLSPRVFTFSLGASSPAGASLNSTNGVFTWIPPGQASPSTNAVTVIVADNNTPSLKATNTFNVVVLPKPSFQSVSSANGQTSFGWSAIPGTIYRVQYTDNLETGIWTDLVPDVTASGPVASASDTSTSSQRFYRVMVVQ